MIRARTSVLVAFTLMLGACPDDRLVVSNGDGSGGTVAGTGGTEGPAAMGGITGDQNGGSSVAASGGATDPPVTGSGGTASGGTTVSPITGSGGAVQGTGGSMTGTGGTTSASTGGTTSGSTGGTAGRATGGTTAAAGGSTGTGGRVEGPCDIYAGASMPCVAAYSMVRALSKSYTGPLFQVRAGSSSNNNTMSGGTTKDIMPGPDGFVDSATVDAACSGYCTVSVLYDHSGNGNDLKRAPKGNTAGGSTGALDDYESIATKGQVMAGGHKVYSLYMNKTEGYRVQTGVTGKNVPKGTAPQGTYELADGTHGGTACCWDFGNVTSTPATEWAFMDAICFGVTYWGRGAGSGPWFGIDFEGGVWTGGTRPGDPGFGGLDNVGPANQSNPSLKVPFALGFIRVKSTEYAIRVADVATASDLTTAWVGGLPVTMNHKGGIVLGVGGDNSNNSFGTFYEGAMVAGYPTNDVELAVMKNVKAVGYSK